MDPQFLFSYSHADYSYNPSHNILISLRILKKNEKLILFNFLALSSSFYF